MDKHLKEKIKETFLKNVEAKNLDEVSQWFTKPYRLYDAEKFCNFVNKFKRKSVRIIGDYDGDGICSTTILFKGLKKSGFSDVSFRIPYRTDGFGLSEKLVDECISDGIHLIITCDNGTTSILPIKKAKEHGISVIVTDHHEPDVDTNGNITLPDADLIINPCAIENSSDFSHYCGAAICYKLMKELLNNDALCNKLLIFAGIATITDIMPLREENYVLVRNSLAKMRNFSNLTAGLLKLFDAIGIKEPTEKDIAFKVGPVLNASERMYPGSAKDIVELLIAEENSSVTAKRAMNAVEINQQRKTEQKRLLARAEKIIIEKTMQENCPLILYLPDAIEGLVGIVASNLADKYHVPTFVLTDSTEPDVIKGSARTYGNISIKKELDEVQNFLLKYGGHNEAGGLTLKRTDLENLTDCLEINMIDYEKPKKEDATKYDVEIYAKDIPDVLVEVTRYAPFGNKNPYIRFKIKDYTLTASYGKYSKIFADSKTVKLNSSIAPALGFGLADDIGEIETPKNMILYGVLNRGYSPIYKKVETTIEFDNFEFIEAESSRTKLAEAMLSL